MTVSTANSSEIYNTKIRINIQRSKVIGYKVNLQKSTVFFYTSSKL